MSYGALASQLISGIGGAVAGGLNAGTQNDLRNQQLQAYANLPAPPDYNQLFQQGFQAQNNATPGQAASDFQLRQQYGWKDAGLGAQIYSAFAPIYAQHNLQTLSAIDPQFLQNYREIGNATASDLANGSNLSPQQLAAANSYINSAQAARGNVLGNSPVAANALYDANAAQALYQQRLGNSMSAANLGGPESRFSALGANAGNQALGQAVTAASTPGLQYFQDPQNWGQQYVQNGYMDWQGNEQNATAQANAAYHAVPDVNPWIASLSAGFGALAGGGKGGGGSSGVGSLMGGSSSLPSGGASASAGSVYSAGGNNLNNPF